MNTGPETLTLLPEMFVLGGAIFALLAGSFLPRNRQGSTRWIAIVALLTGALSSAVGMTQPAMTAFEGSSSSDVASGVARIIICVGTVFVLILGTEELAGTRRESETYTLLLLSALGAMVLSDASDLLILVTGYLLASIPLYALIGMSRSAGAAEAAMKTYLLGALLGITMMLGVAVLYGISATTSYRELGPALAQAPPAGVVFGLVAVLGGLMFKAGAVPGHFWIPDAAQAAGKTVAAFLTTIPKIGALVAAYRLLDIMPDNIHWPLLIGILATASMTLGNLAAFWQDDVRRLLGWSTVSQVGYLLLPVAVAGKVGLALPSLLFYLAAYAVTNLTAFAVVAALPSLHTLRDYRGKARFHPWLTGALVVSLLGLVGTPPTAVFVGKLTTLTAAWEGGLVWLVVIASINSVASLFYYLRWLAPMFFPASSGPHPSSTPTPTPTSDLGTVATQEPWATRAAVTGAVVVLAVGIFAGSILSILGSPLAH